MAEFGCFSFSEGFDYTVPPFFKDIDFWFWKARMTCFIKSSDFEMWNVFTNTFDFRPRKDWTEKEKKMFSLNIRAMKILYSALTENDFEKIKLCSSAKDIWDSLNSIYASSNCVEVESVDSSSNTISCISTIDEQMEVENEEGEISKHFHDLVSTEEQEENDPQEELIMHDYDESLSGAQDAHMVNNSNSSCVFKKNDFEQLHKIVFQPITDSIMKNKNVFNHAGKSCGKKEYTNLGHLILLPLDRHNTCIKSHNAYHHVTCNYCGKSGHISHTCYIRRNSNVRNKYVWVPKGQVRSNTNNQGPKYKWVPKCPSSAPCVQDDLKINGHQGTEKRKKNSRVSHEPRRRFTSVRRTRGKAFTATSSSVHKKQWTQIRGEHSASRIDYHEVPFNYLEENQKRRISRAQRKRFMQSTLYEKALLDPRIKYQRMINWVSKCNPSSA